MLIVEELLAIGGAAFMLLSGIGMLRFPDLYARMHAATKATTLGVALIGAGAVFALGEARFKALIAVAFVFLTGPSAAHFVGRAAYRAEGVKFDLDTQDDLAQLFEDDPGRTGTAGRDV